MLACAGVNGFLLIVSEPIYTALLGLVLNDNLDYIVIVSFFDDLPEDTVTYLDP